MSSVVASILSRGAESKEQHCIRAHVCVVVVVVVVVVVIVVIVVVFVFVFVVVVYYCRSNYKAVRGEEKGEDGEHVCVCMCVCVWVWVWVRPFLIRII